MTPGDHAGRHRAVRLRQRRPARHSANLPRAAGTIRQRQSPIDSSIKSRMAHSRKCPTPAASRAAAYAHGVAVGDTENDGFPDVFVTSFGADRFYHNNGDGTFTDRTAAAGLRSEDASLEFVLRVLRLRPRRLSRSDRDPVRHFRSRSSTARPPTIRSDFGLLRPAHVRGRRCRTLYHNNGDGTFTDVTAKAGIDAPSRGWGVGLRRFHRRRLARYLRRQRRRAGPTVGQSARRHIQGRGYPPRLRLNAAGRPEAGMGIAVGDVNGDRHARSVRHPHLQRNEYALYDAAAPAGAIRRQDRRRPAWRPIDRPFTGWGCGFVDIFNRGILDIAVANGRVTKGPIHPGANLGTVLEPLRRAEAAVSQRRQGAFPGRHRPAPVSYGKVPQVSRGMAFGDLFGDGAISIAVQNLDNSIQVYRNTAPKTRQPLADRAGDDRQARCLRRASHGRSRRSKTRPPRPSHLQLPHEQRPASPFRPRQERPRRCPARPLAERQARAILTCRPSIAC